MRVTPRTSLPAQLRHDIVSCGYFPDFVADSLAMALGDDELLGHLVHQEATFFNDEIHRHLSVLALTADRLIYLHTDDGTEEAGAGDQAITTTESVPLHQIRSVSLSRVVAHPERFNAARPAVVETWLTLGWGVMQRLDLEPASCGDPECEADHGYSGSASGDDLMLRMSPAADGQESVDTMIGFATTLQRAIARAR